MRQDAALQRPSTTPHHVGDEVLEAHRAQSLGDSRVACRVIAGQNQELLDAALRSLVKQGLHPVRSDKCGLCVANALYLQCETHVRDSDKVRLREKATRRRISVSNPQQEVVCARGIYRSPGADATASSKSVPTAILRR